MKTAQQTLKLLRVSFSLWVLFGSQLGSAVEGPPKDDAVAILSKASTEINLQASGSAPYMLLAKVVLREGNKSVEGVFAMAWAAPGQYRRVLRFPNFTQTEVAADGALFRQRSPDALPLMIWELDRLLDVASLFRINPEDKVRRVQKEGSGADELICVLTQASAPFNLRLDAEMDDSRFCVNSATGDPSIRRGSDELHSQSMHEQFGLSDYQTFEGHRFPRKLTYQSWEGLNIEVEVQKLIRAQTFPADEFTPPKGSTKGSFCEAPETRGDIHPNTGNAIPIGFNDVQVEMYFRLSDAGGVQLGQVIHSSDPLKNDEILHWFLGTHFPIRSCAGKPIAYETVVRLATGH